MPRTKLKLPIPNRTTLDDETVANMLWLQYQRLGWTWDGGLKHERVTVGKAGSDVLASDS